MNSVTIALLQTMLMYQQIGIRLERSNPSLKELQDNGMVTVVYEDELYVWVKASQKALDEAGIEKAKPVAENQIHIYINHLTDNKPPTE